MNSGATVTLPVPSSKKPSSAQMPKMLPDRGSHHNWVTKVLTGRYTKDRRNLIIHSSSKPKTCLAPDIVIS